MLARALRAGRGLGAGRGWAAGKTGARRCAVAGGRRWFAGEPQRPADDRDRSRGRALPYGAAARVQVTRTEISQEVFDVSGALREFVPARPAGEQDPWAPADAPGEDVSRGHRVARNRHTAGMESLPSMRPSTPAARCVAYCTAETYDWDALLKALQKDMVPSIFFSEVIHVSVTNENSFREEGDVFFFRDGCMVLWDVTPARTRQLLETIQPFQVGPYERPRVLDTYSEAIAFIYGKQAGLLPTGEVVLSYGQANWAKAQILEKIAFSHGMQRSVKIAVIEDVSDRLIASIKQIPDILTEKRMLKLDEKAVMKTMGQLLSLRGLINLHLPLNETPEAYWEEPWLEELYSKISRELDLAARIRSLNRKLDYAHQVVDVLRSELAEKHHVRLEKIIIYLIAIELFFEVVGLFVH